MDDYISRKAAIDYIRGQSEEWQKAFEELGGESGIYADAYNDLAEDFYRIPAANVAPVVHGRWLKPHWALGRQRVCSVCHNTVRMPSFDSGGSAEYPGCPWCLAKMDGGAE